jgi:hypothetical protein
VSLDCWKGRKSGEKGEGDGEGGGRVSDGDSVALS